MRSYKDKPNDARQIGRELHIRYALGGSVRRAGPIVVVMQRVHQEDLVGYLLEAGGFQVLDLPAIARKPSFVHTGRYSGYYRQTCELLHPEHAPAAILADLKKSMGPMAFSAQYSSSLFQPAAP